MAANLRKLITDYLEEAKFMQIATVSGEQPWSCTVYFICDKNLDLYWISKPDARHSKEIHKNNKIAASIPVKFSDLTVVGIQVEGDADVIEVNYEIKRMIRLYTDRFDRGEKWYENFIAGNNEHKLYRIKPRLFVLFDRVNFPENPRQELKL